MKAQLATMKSPNYHQDPWWALLLPDLGIMISHFMEGKDAVPYDPEEVAEIHGEVDFPDDKVEKLQAYVEMGQELNDRDSDIGKLLSQAVNAHLAAKKAEAERGTSS